MEGGSTRRTGGVKGRKGESDAARSIERLRDWDLADYEIERRGRRAAVHEGVIREEARAN